MGICSESSEEEKSMSSGKRRHCLAYWFEVQRAPPEVIIERLAIDCWWRWPTRHSSKLDGNFGRRLNCPDTFRADSPRCHNEKTIHSVPKDDSNAKRWTMMIFIDASRRSRSSLTWTHQAHWLERDKHDEHVSLELHCSTEAKKWWTSTL